MPEDREAVRTHLEGVRARLYPAIQVDRFPDAKRLIARFERIISDWEAGRTDARAIIEGVNEIVVANRLLKRPLTMHFMMIYEPRITLSGQSIDFLLSHGEERYYFDVKTIRPLDPQNAKQAWEKYGDLRLLFPTNADLVLAEQWLGGEFWHFFSSARAKFLEHALSLERKVASLTVRRADHLHGLLWRPSSLAQGPTGRFCRFLFPRHLSAG